MSTAWSDTARVIDVSHWQSPASLDWKAAAAAGCVGAIIKFTQGASGVDPAARDHSRNAHQAGIPIIGGYHFGDGSDPHVQAKHFLATMRDEYGDDALTDRVVMLDAEQNVPQMTVRQAEIFVSAVRAALGRWPLLYMGHFGPAGNGEGLPSVVLSHCPLMLPAYGDHTKNLALYLAKGWRMPKDGADRGEPGMGVMRLWQFTDGAVNGGPFPGLGKVDQSRLIGFSSMEEAQAALFLAGEPQAPIAAPSDKGVAQTDTPPGAIKGSVLPDAAKVGAPDGAAAGAASSALTPATAPTEPRLAQADITTKPAGASSKAAPPPTKLAHPARSAAPQDDDEAERLTREANPEVFR